MMRYDTAQDGAGFHERLRFDYVYAATPLPHAAAIGFSAADYAAYAELPSYFHAAADADFVAFEFFAILLLFDFAVVCCCRC